MAGTKQIVRFACKKSPRFNQFIKFKATQLGNITKLNPWITCAYHNRNY